MQDETCIEALTLYQKELESAKAAGFSREECKKLANAAVYLKFPDMHGRQDYLGSVGKIVQQVLPRQKPPKQERLPEKPVNGEPDKTFMTIMRAAALTGFIPRGIFLAPFVNGKSRQVSAYITFLRREGWECKETEYGWITVKTKTIEEQIADLMQKLNEAFGRGDFPACSRYHQMIEALKREGALKA